MKKIPTWILKNVSDYLFQTSSIALNIFQWRFHEKYQKIEFSGFRQYLPCIWNFIFDLIGRNMLFCIRVLFGTGLIIFIWWSSFCLFINVGFKPNFLWILLAKALSVFRIFVVVCLNFLVCTEDDSCKYCRNMDTWNLSRIKCYLLGTTFTNFNIFPDRNREFDNSRNFRLFKTHFALRQFRVNFQNFLIFL